MNNTEQTETISNFEAIKLGMKGWMPEIIESLKGFFLLIFACIVICVIAFIPGGPFMFMAFIVIVNLIAQGRYFHKNQTFAHSIYDENNLTMMWGTIIGIINAIVWFFILTS